MSHCCNINCDKLCFDHPPPPPIKKTRQRKIKNPTLKAKIVNFTDEIENRWVSPDSQLNLDNLDTISDMKTPLNNKRCRKRKNNIEEKQDQDDEHTNFITTTTTTTTTTQNSKSAHLRSVNRYGLLDFDNQMYPCFSSSPHQHQKKSSPNISNNKNPNKHEMSGTSLPPLLSSGNDNNTDIRKTFFNSKFNANDSFYATNRNDVVRTIIVNDSPVALYGSTRILRLNYKKCH